jgi:hypothetical protein
MIDIIMALLLRSPAAPRALLKAVLTCLIALMPLAMIIGLGIVFTDLKTIMFATISVMAAMAAILFLDRRFLKKREANRIDA